jgi:cytochrome c oxidase cbb3-type subunit III
VRFPLLKAGAVVVAIGAGLLCGFSRASAPQTAAQPQQSSPNPPVQPPSAYPSKPVADPKLAEEGKNSFSVRCAFCHGGDARGGEGGPNLLHSQIVLNDQNGESIKALVRNGRVAQGMPSFDLDEAQLDALVAYLHSLPVSSHERTNSVLVIPTGDAKAGAVEFQKNCSSCHSATGDLSGIGKKIPDPKTLQQTWLMPGSRAGAELTLKPKLATVTLADGQSFTGQLKRIDDFIVTIQLESGHTRTFSRHGEDNPKVAVDNPLEGHIKLLPIYSDKAIHDITAYLESLK